MNKAALSGILVVGGALLAYFLNFNEWAGLSIDKGDWGTFGDFVGGFSNPILTFITMCLLIRSIDLQREANKSVIAQGQLADSVASRQKVIDDLRSFESTFFSLAQYARDEFEKLEIVDESGMSYRAGRVVSFCEETIIKHAKDSACRNSNPDFIKLFDELVELSGMGVFSCVRGFYITYKFAYESCPDGYREKYLDICLNIMPVRLLNLVCLSVAYAEWGLLKYIEGKGVCKVKGNDDYLKAWVDLMR